MLSQFFILLLKTKIATPLLRYWRCLFTREVSASIEYISRPQSTQNTYTSFSLRRFLWKQKFFVLPPKNHSLGLHPYSRTWFQNQLLVRSTIWPLSGSISLLIYQPTTAHFIWFIEMEIKPRRLRLSFNLHRTIAEFPRFPQCALRIYMRTPDKIYTHTHTHTNRTAFSRFIEPFSRCDLTSFIDVSD